MNVHKENQIIEVAYGRALTHWHPGKQFSVPDGYVQGGLINALADAGQALALITTHEEFVPWVTTDLQTRFIRPIKIGTAVHIENIVRSKTKTTAIVESTFTIDGEKLAAIITGGWRDSQGRRPITVK